MINPAELNHQISTKDTEFSDFINARELNGTWNRLRTTRLPPDLPPELMQYAQGQQFMAGMLDDDIRILKAIHGANPTRIDARIHGGGQGNRDTESDFKLCMASWWDNDLNEARWLDDYAYEGQITQGLTVPFLRWKKQPKDDGGDRPESGCPAYIEKTLVESFRYQGDYRNPSVAWLKYSLGVIDCDIKKDGQRPGYSKDSNVLQWYESDSLPTDYYQDNGNKKVSVIVRDQEDPIAMCPLPGCDHRQRKITIYICPENSKADKYEEVEEYDSPFKRCSLLVVGGDIRHTQRDPHLIFRPSAWVLYDLVLKYNNLFNQLLAMTRRELSDESKYIDPSGVDKETVTALTANAEGGSKDTIEKPEIGSRDIAVLPGSVKSYGNPSTAALIASLDRIEREYAKRRPPDALTGTMALSEVTGTGATLQVQGAGMLIGDDLKNWDSMITRIFEEIKHGISFTGYFEEDDRQTKYTATISGRENVLGFRNKGAGQEVYLDARKCAKSVQFTAVTSKDTPSESRNRKLLAITGKKEGIYTQHDVFQAWDIFDEEAQDEELFREDVRELIRPLRQRRIALILAAKSAALTGMDLGEEQMMAQTIPDVADQGGQTHNTQAANDARLHAPPVQAPEIGTPQGGSSPFPQ